jgi:hypothetical protein
MNKLFFVWRDENGLRKESGIRVSNELLRQEVLNVAGTSKSSAMSETGESRAVVADSLWIEIDIL